MKSPSLARAPATALLPDAPSAGIVETAAGCVAWSVTPRGLRRLTLPRPTKAEALRDLGAPVNAPLPEQASRHNPSPSEPVLSEGEGGEGGERVNAKLLHAEPLAEDWRGLASRLQRYYGSQPVTFDDLPLDLDGLTPFTRNVVLAVRAIPRGQVCSYGQVAASVGRPGAARAVGAVMARNPICLVVPCHRVVGSDGTLTGFGGGLPLKRRMLEMEGTGFEEQGARVSGQGA